MRHSCYLPAVLPGLERWASSQQQGSEHGLLPFHVPGCGAQTCLVVGASLSLSLWILSNPCQSLECVPSCSLPSTSWNPVAWAALASLIFAVLTSGTRPGMGCLPHPLIPEPTHCPYPVSVIPTMGKISFLSWVETRFLISACLFLPRGRSPDWYNKVFGHLCAMEVAKIRDSFPTLQAAGPETKL